MKHLTPYLSRHKKDLFVLGTFFVFANFIMWKTFRVRDGNILIASKIWSDFSATLPLIRSFSLGDNFPPQYPLFAGLPIRYHFAFFLVVGMLEKIGFRIDWAVNGLCSLAFFLLLTTIYLFANKIFKDRRVGLLSAILFLFNGSLGFLEFFKKNPLSLSTLSNIFHNTEFTSFGPYDGKTVSAFWSLNIYTNQRHLALAYASFIAFLLYIYKFAKTKKVIPINQALVLGIAIGLFPFVHLPTFGMLLAVLGLYFLLFPKLRSSLFLTGLVAVILAAPQIVYMGASQTNFSYFNPGYLIDNLTPASFIVYWTQNLGLPLFIGLVGFLKVDKTVKKLFLPFFAFFVIANLFQFSPEIAGNHKFFNLFLIGIDILAAYVLVEIWEKKAVGKVFVACILLPLTLTGIIDFFPVVNDQLIELPDYNRNSVVNYIASTTPKDAVFLNASFLYDPASIAGRKIYLGWPYFSWSAGYDTDTRFQKMKTILSASDKQAVCRQLRAEQVGYLELQKPTQLEDVVINYSFFDANFTKIYTSPDNDITLYDVTLSCQQS